MYRDHVPPAFAASVGDWVRIEAGSYVGYGLWDPDSPVALRIYSRQGVPDERWVGDRIREAWQVRAAVRESGTTAFRWVNGEGDGMPGVVVDLYADYGVLVTYSAAVDSLVRSVANALRATTRLKGVVQRSHTGMGALQVLAGRAPPTQLIVEENEIRMHVRLHDGQKTGLFLDQRENRRFVAQTANGRSVLNLFCYTGGFSLHAARAGASRVTSVDAAAGAVAAARDNFALNGIDPELHDFAAADAFEYLQQAYSDSLQFDLVISDPPSFARTRGRRESAIRAYRRLHELALPVVRPFGLYAAASCTAQVSPEQFRATLSQAARRRRRRLQILHEASQPLDHPIMAGHPEGRYLKFVVGRVLPVC